MGYRSDVRIITSKQGFNKLKKYINEFMNQEEYKNNVYNLLNNLDIDIGNNKIKYFGWNDIKWYYSDANLIEKGLNKLQDDDYSYKFSRIGDNYEDTEEIIYESKTRKNEKNMIHYYNLERYFNDDYIEELINQNDKTIKKNDDYER